MTFLETRNSKETQAAPYILDIYAGFGHGGNSGAISVNAGIYNAGEVVTLKIPYRGKRLPLIKLLAYVAVVLYGVLNFWIILTLVRCIAFKRNIQYLLRNC